MSHHFKPGIDSSRSCWTCYWQNGEKCGDHLICWSEWPRKTVIGIPDRGCAFWTAVPEEGEPKPLPRSSR